MTNLIPQKITKLKPYFLAIISGILWFISCPPYPFWYFAWFAMVPLYYAIRNKTPKQAFFIGWLTGLVATIGGFPWIMDLVIRFAHLPSFFAFFVLLIYSFYQGLILAIFAYVVAKFSLSNSSDFSYPLWIVAPIAVVVIEYLFPLIFPWYFAITQAFVLPVIQITEFTGPVGVGFLLILFSSFIFNFLTLLSSKQKPALFDYIPVIILVVILAWSFWRIHNIRNTMKNSDTIGVAMIQHNMGILLGQSRYTHHKELLLHQVLSKKSESLKITGQISKLDLIVWSESSYPYRFSRTQKQDYPQNDIRKAKRDFTTPLFFGVGTYDPNSNDKVYNSALLLDKQDKIAGMYDKIWLLAFGEAVPFYEHLGFLHDFFRKHNFSNLSRGEKAKLITLKVSNKKNVKLGPLICYEDILPSFSRKISSLGAEILVNITNDAWFGAEQEPYEHFALAILRSTESRLAMIRNVNNGVSALIMPDGSIKTFAPSKSSQIDPFPREHPDKFKNKIENTTLIKLKTGVWSLPVWPNSYVVTGEVPIMKSSQTFFTKFGNVFSWFMILSLILIIFDYKTGFFRKKFTKFKS